ncbi:lysozyme [Cellulophaga phage phi19:1]|uniref:Lysozyme n=1 Tax=Cellulophaga phage phi19:1 TaxID=1327970 RepID=R9ZZL3_9CAUD|nr:lysozyme [Cellulophaga phage phi19:1]AGO47403.1 lysozyme [Cellulophaga phage phi19:1]
MKKIIEFQKENGLVADGVIGKNTMKAFDVILGIRGVQLANFLGQLHVESGGFKYDTESLNYSATALPKIFGYYKSRPLEALVDGRTWLHKANQETIANKVYWDKYRSTGYQLGNKYKDDGWKYIGRGAIQLTGYSNYLAFSKSVNDSMIVITPEIVATKYYWTAAKWFFDKNRLWGLSNSRTVSSITQLTKRINGGSHGLSERIYWTNHYAKILGV